MKDQDCGHTTMIKQELPCHVQDLKDTLIYTRISGYGQTGPKAHLAGYASVCEAYGGIRCGRDALHLAYKAPALLLMHSPEDSSPVMQPCTS